MIFEKDSCEPHTIKAKKNEQKQNGDKQRIKFSGKNLSSRWPRIKRRRKEKLRNHLNNRRKTSKNCMKETGM